MPPFFWAKFVIKTLQSNPLTYLLLLVGLILTGYLYWPGLMGPFLLDDLQTISLARVNSFDLGQIWATSWANHTGPLGRPLSILSFIVTDLIWGQTSFGYKVVNLGLHLINGLLCFCLLNRWLALHTDSRLSLRMAAFVALLWVAHPLMVSTTLYAVQRMAILSTMMMLLSMICYLQCRFYSTRKMNWAIACIIFFGGALASKENSLTLVFFLLVIELTTPKPRQSKRWTQVTAISCMMLMVGGLCFYIARWPAFAATFEAKGFTLGQYCLVQAQALVFYLKLIALPSLSQMSLYHDDFVQVFGLNPWVCVAILSLLVMLAIKFKEQLPVISFGILWFFCGHAIESTILPLEPVFEHRNYLSSIGILLCLSWGIYHILQATTFKKLIPYLGLSLVIGFGLLTALRVSTWSNPAAFLQVMVENHPKSPRAHIEHAQYLFATQQTEKAFAALDIADSLAKQSGPKLHQLAALCQSKPSAELLEHVHDRLKHTRITPYTLLIFDSMVTAKFQAQCPAVPSSQMLELLQLAIANPSIQQKPDYLATLHHLQAGILVQQQAMRDAIQSLDKAFALNPNKIEPALEKIKLLHATGQAQLAHESLNQLKTYPQIKLMDNQQKVKELEQALSSTIVR